jgi:hypothetical protein
MPAIRTPHWQSSSIYLLPKPVMERQPSSCPCSKFATQPSAAPVHRARPSSSQDQGRNGMMNLPGAAAGPPAVGASPRKEIRGTAKPTAFLEDTG